MKICQINSDDIDLNTSKLLDAAYKTMDYAREHGGIPLTKSGAFNRKFSTWAADNFNWPEYSTEELMKMNKVIDEIDMPAAAILHDFLYSLQYGRHVKGKFQFTKKTQKLAEDKSRFFIELATNYLFNYDHDYRGHISFTPLVNWDVFLNVLNVETHTGAPEDHLLKTFYGFDAGDWQKEGYWDHSTFLLWNVLKPLSWVGFLDERHPNEFHNDGSTIYTKTALWRKSLRLDTDNQLNLRIVSSQSTTTPAKNKP